MITTDQGGEVHNSLNAEMMTALGIKHRLTTTYHPQANGLDERWNQTLITTIVKFIAGKPEEWDEFPPEIANSYNTAVQEVSILHVHWCNCHTTHTHIQDLQDRKFMSLSMYISLIAQIHHGLNNTLCIM